MLFILSLEAIIFTIPLIILIGLWAGRWGYRPRDMVLLALLIHPLFAVAILLVAGKYYKNVV